MKYITGTVWAIITTAALVSASFFGTAALSASASTLGPNLISNPSFESGTTGWTQVRSGNSNATFTYPVVGFDGGNAARVNLRSNNNNSRNGGITGGSGTAYWQSPIALVTAGKQYQFSGYSDSNSNASVEVVATYTSSTGATSRVILGSVNGTGAWKQFTQVITIPSGITQVQVAHVVHNNGSVEVDQYALQEVIITPPPPPGPKPTISSFTATPTVIANGSSTVLAWVVANASSTSINQGVGIVTGNSKSVSPTATTTYTLTATNPNGSATSSVTVAVLQPAAPVVPPVTPPASGPNLIPNGDFELGTTNNPTGWNADYWGTMTTKFTYPVAGKNGGKAAQIQVTKYSSGDAKWDFNHITVSPHTIYQFSDDYMSTVVNNVSVEFLMSDGTYVYQWIADAPATNGAWQTLTAQITVPTGAVSMTVLHTIAAVGTLTTDNASLVSQPAAPFANAMVTFTFDDGDLSQYQNALPILTAAGLPASFFIITSEPTSGDSGYMSWAQIKDLASKGFEIGGHTRTHPFLTQLTTAQAQTEISGSFTDLVAQGITPKTFVYPYGDRNAATDALVKAAGYVGSRGSYYGLDAPFTPRYNLDDIRVDSTTSLASLEAEVDHAVADKRWLVLEIHDVLASGGDTYAITPAFFQSLVNYVKQSGAQVVTLQSGLNFVQ